MAEASLFQVGLRIGDANRAGLDRGMVGEGFQLPAGRKNRAPGDNASGGRIRSRI
jgi:hypothetical protein